MNKYLAFERQLPDGFQKIYFFPNGFGASVVKLEYTPGFEVAIIKGNIKHYSIVDMADNYLTDEELEDLLKEIKNY